MFEAMIDLNEIKRFSKFRTKPERRFRDITPETVETASIYSIECPTQV
jgi:hypothetical protein